MHFKIGLIGCDKKLRDKITNGVINIGGHVAALAREDFFQDFFQENPNLIIANLDVGPQKWQDWIPQKKQVPHVPILGYSDEIDPLKRMKKAPKSIDATIHRKALAANPTYQILLFSRSNDIDEINHISTTELPTGVIRGIELYNQGKYHEAHDAIEPIWLKEKRGVRKLYAGFLQAGICFYMIELGKWSTSLRMFQCAKHKLKLFLPNCLGIDTADLYSKLIICEEELKKLGPKKYKNFDWSLVPKIKLNT